MTQMNRQLEKHLSLIDLLEGEWGFERHLSGGQHLNGRATWRASQASATMLDYAEAASWVASGGEVIESSYAYVYHFLPDQQLAIYFSHPHQKPIR